LYEKSNRPESPNGCLVQLNIELLNFRRLAFNRLFPRFCWLFFLPLQFIARIICGDQRPANVAAQAVWMVV
jgi:hypothetical protein